MCSLSSSSESELASKPLLKFVTEKKRKDEEKMKSRMMQANYLTYDFSNRTTNPLILKQNIEELTV